MAQWVVAWTPGQAAQTLSKWRGLLTLGSPVKYAGHSVVFSQGDIPHEVFLLASGIAKLVLILPGGDELILGLRYPGQFIDYFPRSSGVASRLSGITIVTSNIHRIAIERVQAAQLANPGLRIQTADLLWCDLYNLAHRHLHFRVSPPADRLERLLWDLSAILGKRDSRNRTRLVLSLSNFEMASLCGVSESHYKAVRRELEDTGRVRHESPHVWVLTSPLASHTPVFTPISI